MADVDRANVVAPGDPIRCRANPASVFHQSSIVIVAQGPSGPFTSPTIRHDSLYSFSVHEVESRLAVPTHRFTGFWKNGFLMLLGPTLAYLLC